MVRNDIIQLYGEDKAYTAGLKVYTTLHSDLQKTAVNAMRDNLHQFDERHSYRTSQQQKRPLNSSYNTGSTYPAQVTQINEQQLTAKLKDGTEIIWICNVMGFFFKFGKQIEENNRIQYLTKLAYISVKKFYSRHHELVDSTQMTNDLRLF
jgi:penicillin-binding protein 1A